MFTDWLTITILLPCIFLIALYFYFTRKFTYWKKRNAPYVPPIPFFGNSIDVFTFKKNMGEFVRKMYQSSTKPFVGFFIFDEPYLLIRDPELVKSILVKDFAVFSNRTVFDNERDDAIGSNILFVLKNPEWRDMRRKMTPVFTSGKMKNMYNLIAEAGDAMLNCLTEESEKNSKIDVREFLFKYSTETITSTAFGINANCFKDENSEFLQVAKRALNYRILERAISTTCYFLAPNLVKLFRLKFVDTASSEFLKNAFWKTMIDREERKVVRNDLLDILIDMKNNEQIDDSYKLEGDKLVAQAVQFFVGGTETTSATITFALFELARNKDIQNRLRTDIREAVGKHGEISYNSLNEMGYLDKVIKETLRKYPPLAFLDRRCSSNYKIPGTDVVIEKGIPVFISHWGLHYDPEYFPDPDQFDPMRFTEENIKSRPQFSYLPFGDGPRNCIGARFGLLSSKSAVAKIISQFEVELSEKGQTLKLDPRGITLSPTAGFSLLFKKL